MIRTQFTDNRNPVFYPLHEEPIVFSKALLDSLLTQKNPSDCIALYCFYYYTAKWQKTNQPKATDNYCMDGLKWGYRKFQRTQRTLIRLKLIERIQHRDTSGKIIGWFVKVQFVWSKLTDTNIPTQNSQKPELVKSSSGKRKINALSSNNRNALNSNTHKNLIPPPIELVIKYCQERKNNIDPNGFINFYSSKGWLIGKNKMVDWQAAIRTWEKNNTLKKIQIKNRPPHGEYTIEDDGLIYDWNEVKVGYYNRYHPEERYIP